MAETKKKFPVKKLLVALATVLMVVLFFVQPFEGLSAEGMKFLGIFIWWIVLMATGVFAAPLACFAALVITVAVGVSDLATAFSSFSGSTGLLLIGAFGMATALGNSGILTRIALLVMKLFPGTYVGQLWAVSCASIILAPTIPSAAAKSSILMPIVGSIADEMGYEPHSKGAVGLLSCCNTITQFIGLMFLTGGVGCMLMVSISGVPITWMGWLKFALVWGVVMFVLTVLFHQFYYNPNKGNKEEAKKLDKQVIQDRIDALGKMKGKEAVALIVLVAAVVLWITESKHGIPSAAVALGGWLILTSVGHFSIVDLQAKISWITWTNVVGVMAMCTLMSITGVAPWLGNLVSPVISSFAGNSFILVFGILILHLLLSFVMVFYNVTGAVFVSLLAVAPISPLAVMFIACQASSTFVLPFQQVGVIGSLAVAGGRVEHKDIVPAAWAWVVCNVIATLATIPWWKFLGYLG